MNRRKFLGILSLGTVASIVGFFSFSDFDTTVEKIIFQDTKLLKIEPGAIKRFLKEARKKNIYDRFTFGKREFLRAHYFFSNALFTLPYYSKYTQYRSEIVGKFLLSTDFFENKMDTSRTIRYTLLYDPYHRPCSHPFSNLFYS